MQRDERLQCAEDAVGLQNRDRQGRLAALKRPEVVPKQIWEPIDPVAGLSGHENDANHFREEGRCRDLDQRGRLHPWRNDLRALSMLLARPWTQEEDERRNEFVARGASDIRAAAALKRRKEVSASAPASWAARFPPLQRLGRSGLIRLTTNGEKVVSLFAQALTPPLSESAPQLDTCFTEKAFAFSIADAPRSCPDKAPAQNTIRDSPWYAMMCLLQSVMPNYRQSEWQVRKHNRQRIAAHARRLAR
jgi:hypothetical protein